MKRCSLRLKDLLAILIAVGALIVGVPTMFNSEWYVALKNPAADPAAIRHEFLTHVLPGIQNYSLAIGAILLAVGIAYILLGAEEDISTSLDEQDVKK
jgi:hypothetical protein